MDQPHPSAPTHAPPAAQTVAGTTTAPHPPARPDPPPRSRVTALWHPDVLVVGATLAGFLLAAGPGAVALTTAVRRLLPSAGAPLQALAAALGGELVLCGALAVVVATRGWWQQAGVATTWPRLAAGLGWLGWLVPLLLLLVRIAVLAAHLHGATAPPAGVPQGTLLLLVGLLVAATAATAVAEEVLFRGLVLGVLLAAWGTSRRGVYPAAVATSGLFGLAHLLVGGPLATVLLHVCVAAAIGLVWAGVRLRTGSVWVGVVLHWLLDVTALLTLLGSASAWWLGIPATHPSVGLAVVLLLLVVGGLELIESACRSGACQQPQPTR